MNLTIVVSLDKSIFVPWIIEEIKINLKAAFRRVNTMVVVTCNIDSEPWQEAGSLQVELDLPTLGKITVPREIVLRAEVILAQTIEEWSFHRSTEVSPNQLVAG
jgi:hypothetical protein